MLSSIKLTTTTTHTHTFINLCRYTTLNLVQHTRLHEFATGTQYNHVTKHAMCTLVDK